MKRYTLSLLIVLLSMTASASLLLALFQKMQHMRTANFSGFWEIQYFIDRYESDERNMSVEEFTYPEFQDLYTYYFGKDGSFAIFDAANEIQTIGTWKNDSDNIVIYNEKGQSMHFEIASITEDQMQLINLGTSNEQREHLCCFRKTYLTDKKFDVFYKGEKRFSNGQPSEQLPTKINTFYIIASDFIDPTEKIKGFKGELMRVETNGDSILSVESIEEFVFQSSETSLYNSYYDSGISKGAEFVSSRYKLEIYRDHISLNIPSKGLTYFFTTYNQFTNAQWILYEALCINKKKRYTK